MSDLERDLAGMFARLGDNPPPPTSAPEPTPVRPPPSTPAPPAAPATPAQHPPSTPAHAPRSATSRGPVASEPSVRSSAGFAGTAALGSIVAAILLIAGSFLPWVTFTSAGVRIEVTGTGSMTGSSRGESVTEELVGATAPGVWTILLGAIIAVGAFLLLRTRAPRVGAGAIVLAGIAATSVTALFASGIISELSNDDDYGKVAAGTGLWMAIGGAVLAIAAGIAGLVFKPDLSSGQEVATHLPQNAPVRQAPPSSAPHTPSNSPAPRSVPSPPHQPVDFDTRMANLKKLGELRDAGILTQQEFEEQKARLL